MMNNSIFATAFLVTLFSKYGVCSSTTKYAVPEPETEVFAQGFREYIPDQEGTNLIAFHGNINLPPLDSSAAGQISNNILKKKEDRWIFGDAGSKMNIEIVPNTSPKSEPLLPVDKDVKDNWHFEQLDNSNPNNQINPPSTSTEQKPLSTCCQLFLNVTNQIAILSEKIDQLTEENKILRAIAQKGDHNARTLRISGKYPSEYYPTPKEFAQNLISEKLKLSGIKVIDVKKTPENEISFKVEELEDKLKIILAAQVELAGSNYQILW